MTYKIAHKLVHIDNRGLKLQNRKTCHQYWNTFQIQNRLQEIIYPQTIADWNALPEDAVIAPSWCHLYLISHPPPPPPPHLYIQYLYTDPPTHSTFFLLYLLREHFVSSSLRCASPSKASSSPSVERPTNSTNVLKLVSYVGDEGWKL